MVVRADIVWSLRAYADTGRPTGGFLRAVLENDLLGAFRRADPENLATLGEIVGYCYNEIPGTCWGSQERVNAWLALHWPNPVPAEVA